MVIRDKLNKVLLFLVIGVILLPFYNVKAYQLCPKSEEYIKWEALKDKDKYLQPKYCAETALKKVAYSRNSLVKEVLPPPFYDLRDVAGVNYTTAVKNQGTTGMCWAFATTSVLESKMKLMGDVPIIYSPRHIEYATSYQFLDGINPLGYNRTVDQGGNYYYSSNYLIKNIGPVKESDMPFSNDTSRINLSAIDKKAMLDVNDITFLESRINGCAPISSKIKKKIMENGSIGALINYDLNYYDPINKTYNYTGGFLSNHAVTIIGWDDNYDRTKFKNVATNNGAWLVQNSYGTSFGTNGYFYISYEDNNICSSLMSIDSYDQDFEKNHYHSSLLGTNSSVGYVNTDTSYAAYTFTRKTSAREVIGELTFAVADAGTYTIYMIDGPLQTVAGLTPDAMGTIDAAGYKTIRFTDKYMTASQYTVVIKYSGALDGYHVPISVKYAGSYNSMTIKPAESFVSANGESWTDLAGDQAALVISVSSDNADLEINTMTNTLVNGKTNLNFSANYIKEPALINYKITNSKNNEKVFNFNPIYEGNRLKAIEAVYSGELGEDSYQLTVTYDGQEYHYSFAIGGPSPYNYFDPNIVRDDTILNFYTPGFSIASVVNVFGPKTTVMQDGMPVSSGVLTNLMTLNYLSDSFKVIIKGDVTNDGYVKINDLAKLSKYIIDGSGLSTEDILNADITGDKVFKINDLAKMSKYIIEGGSLK